MGKIVVSMFVSLDNVIQDPQNWSLNYWNDPISEFKNAELFGHEALLLGRVTYVGFEEAWTPRAGSDAYTDRINTMPKYVASNTLTSANWGESTIIRGDVAGELRKIKETVDGDLLVFGSGNLIQTLVKENLVDRYNLLIYPVIVGNGQRLFEEGLEQTPLNLVDSKVYDNGVALHIYEAISE